jgi:hypothetical protein
MREGLVANGFHNSLRWPDAQGISRPRVNSDSPTNRPSLQERSSDHDQHTSASSVEGVERRGGVDLGGVGGRGCSGAAATSADGNGGGGGSDSSWAREGAVVGWVGGGDGCDDLGDGDGLGHGRGRRQGGRGAARGDSQEREEEGSGDSRELHCGGLMDSIEGSVEVVRRC